MPLQLLDVYVRQLFFIYISSLSLSLSLSYDNLLCKPVITLFVINALIKWISYRVM